MNLASEIGELGSDFEDSFWQSSKYFEFIYSIYDLNKFHNVFNDDSNVISYFGNTVNFKETYKQQWIVSSSPFWFLFQLKYLLQIQFWQWKRQNKEGKVSPTSSPELLRKGQSGYLTQLYIIYGWIIISQVNFIWHKNQIIYPTIDYWAT